MLLTILIIQDIALFSLLIDIITRLYVLGIKSIKITKYTIFINDIILTSNLIINNIIYFTQNNSVLDYLNFLNFTFCLLFLFRFICIIVFLKNTRKKQINVRVRSLLYDIKSKIKFNFLK